MRTIQHQEFDKKEIIEKLKDEGCRITQQRLLLLDVLFDGGCESCKQLYYRAVKKDPNLGTATVYRFVNTLEQLKVLNRKQILQFV